MVISRDEIEYKDFLENCKILNEQGKFINLEEAQNEIWHIIDGNLISIKKNSKYCKKFYEEICPICYLAKYLGAQSVCLTDDIEGHFSYDAVIKFEDGKEQLLECTTAIDGYHNVLRNEHLKKYGYAPCRAKIDFKGTINKREINPSKRNSYILGNQVRFEILNNIEKVFLKKKEKNRKEYLNAFLLIVVDCDGMNTAELKAFIQEESRFIFDDKAPFHRIFLIHKNPQKYVELFSEI